MKFRKAAAVITAVILAFSLSSCLKYNGDILSSTTAPADNATDTDIGEPTEPRQDNNGETPAAPTGEQQTDAQNPAENTTGAGKAESTTSGSPQTAKPNTPTATKPSQSSGSTTNGFDVMKSGNFYWKGRMLNEEGQVVPAEMASTKNSLYIATNLQGADVGILIQGKNTYLIYPRIKGYMNMKSLLSLTGMSGDFFDTESFDFSSLGSLSSATSTHQENFNNKDCTAYVFNENSGTTEIFMSGSSFVGMRSTDSRGNMLSAIYVDYLTNKVPADKSAPPSDYTEYSGVKTVSFVSELMKDMNVSSTN